MSESQAHCEATVPTPPLRSTVKILRRRFQIQDAVFVFDGGMSSKINLQSLEDEGLEFVTRLSNSTLEALPAGTQLELSDAHRLLEIQHGGKRQVLAGGLWHVRICLLA